MWEYSTAIFKTTLSQYMSSPNNAELMGLIIDMAKSHYVVKRAYCKSYPMSDSPTVVMCAYDDANDDSFRIGVLPLFSDEESAPHQCILDCSNELPPLKFKYMAVCLEGYSLEAENINDIDAQDDFENNPFSKVEQNITIIAIDWEIENLMTCVMTYVWDDDGLPVPTGQATWGEFTVSDYPDNGMQVLGESLTTLATAVKNNVRALSN